MAKQIEWTPQALQDFAAVVFYLESSWSDQIADSFISVTTNKLSLLSHQPFIGRRSNKEPDVRSILLTKHNRLYYKVQGHRLIVLNIFPTRQDPKKTKY